MLASERICSRSWNECLCIVKPNVPPGPLQLQTPGPMGQPGLLSNFLPFTVEATHLPTSCPRLPLGWGRRQVNCLGTVRSGGNKAEEQVWVGVRDEPELGPCSGTGAIGAPTCSFTWPGSGERGEKPCRDRRGLGNALAPGRSCLRAYGASGTGKWKWFSRTQAPPLGGPELRPSLRGPATRAAPAGDLPSLGEMRPQSGVTLSGRPRHPTQRRKERARAEDTQPHKALQWRPGAGPQPAGTPPRLGRGLCRSAARWGGGSGKQRRPRPWPEKAPPTGLLHLLHLPPGENGPPPTCAWEELIGRSPIRPRPCPTYAPPHKSVQRPLCWEIPASQA